MKLKHIIFNLALLLIFSNTFGQKKKAAPSIGGSLSGYYLNMKNGLIVSDKENVAKGADTLAKAIAGLQKKSIKKVAQAANLDSVSKYAVQIAATDNINKQRKSFSALSTYFWQLVEKADSAQPLYLQVCPMTGDKWVSKEKEIKNPYFPKNMLTCGEVKGQSGVIGTP